MSKSTMRIILVVSKEGENPDEIAMKYAKEEPVEPYLIMKRSDTKKFREKQMASISEMINGASKTLFSDEYREAMENILTNMSEMTDDEYFKKITEGCVYNVDDEGNAYSTVDPNKFYDYPKCFQTRYEKTGEEAEFSTPFTLKDGTKSYRAHFNDIDWDFHHGRGREIYEAAWEVCVEGREPKTEQEKIIKEKMSERKKYFSNFSSKEEYVTHSTSFFAFGIADSDSYKGFDFSGQSEIDWVFNFYNKFIFPLGNSGNPLISVYEIKTLANKPQIISEQ